MTLPPNGFNCPVCNSHYIDVEYGGINENLNENCTCQNCGSTWTNCYVFVEQVDIERSEE